MPGTTPTSGLRKILTNTRELPVIVFLGLVLSGTYIWFLNHQERRAETYFKEMRDTNPEKYLREIKLVSGFDAYLREYAVLDGMDKPNVEAPEFFLGRWSLETTPKRVSDSYESITCSSAMLVENGRITFPGAFRPIEPVRYSLRENELVLTLPAHGEKIVRLVSSGVYLHHIELTLPGSDQTSYGYRCK